MPEPNRPSTSGEPANKYAEAVDAEVSARLITRFAPLVDWVARRLDPGLASVVTRPATRKVLAFDDWAQSFVAFSFMVFLYMVGNVMLGLARLIFGNQRGLEQMAAGTAIGMVVAAVGSLGAATRVRHFARVFARCVTVTGRVVSTTDSSRWGEATKVLIVDYPYASATRQARLSFVRGRHHLVSPTPELLVDPGPTGHAFIKDLYV